MRGTAMVADVRPVLGVHTLSHTPSFVHPVDPHNHPRGGSYFYHPPSQIQSVFLNKAHLSILQKFTV